MKKQLGQRSPEFIKKIYRLFRYKNDRHKFIREFEVRKKQNLFLRERHHQGGERLIVFLIPGSDWATGKDRISGGTISIVSICEKTAGLGEIHGAQTIMSTMRNDHLLLRHEMFENATTVLRFEQLAGYFHKVSEILIHIPEFLAEYFLSSLAAADRKWMQKMDSVHINIMNQNIKLMPPLPDIARLRTIADKVTITTAHQKYCSRYYREYYGIPIHKLSVWISPEQYMFRRWEEKENLLVVSPDKHPMKEEILRRLENIPGLTLQIISNLTYGQYKELIARAKWSLTFGEGLDGYLIEPVFSGAIGFAVYNENFFTPDFEPLPTIYKSYEQMLEHLPDDIRRLDRKDDFMACQKQQFALCAKYYSYDTYEENIKAFYRGQYSLP